MENNKQYEKMTLFLADSIRDNSKHPRYSPVVREVSVGFDCEVHPVQDESGEWYCDHGGSTYRHGATADEAIAFAIAQLSREGWITERSAAEAQSAILAANRNNDYYARHPRPPLGVRA